jgi:GH25 family lysozyme M1 (1,4-beta-N-acetylmuramidase)
VFEVVLRNTSNNADIETNKSNLSPAEVTKWIEAFYSTLKFYGYQKLMLYSYQPFFDQYLQPSTLLADTKLWLADYRPVPTFQKAGIFTTYGNTPKLEPLLALMEMLI